MEQIEEKEEKLFKHIFVQVIKKDIQDFSEEFIEECT